MKHWRRSLQRSPEVTPKREVEHGGRWVNESAAEAASSGEQRHGRRGYRKARDQRAPSGC